MRIALFNYRVLPIDPVGGMQRRMLAALCEEHDFVVFAREFDNPRPGRIRHVRVACPRRPLALQFVAYRIMARPALWFERRRSGEDFDLVQSIESSTRGAELIDCHFCHRAFVRHPVLWQGGLNLRAVFRWIDHHMRAATEPGVYRHCRHVVVPSHGLRRELEAEYPRLKGRIEVIGDPIDTAALRPAAGFDRQAFRSSLGVVASEILLVFIALGHFERKGLPLVLDALAQLGDPRIKLVVVGGPPDLVRSYRAKARQRGIADRVVFIGAQGDTKPFLWAADAFIFPSAYETFSIVCYEAAAAGLPLIVSSVHGVSDIASHGDNAFVVERTSHALAAAISALAACSAEGRQRMGDRAAQAVAAFTPEAYIEGWRLFYQRLARTRRVSAVTARPPPQSVQENFP